MIFGLSKELNQEIPRSQRVSLVMKPRPIEILKALDALCDEAAELFVRRLTFVSLFFFLLGCIPRKARTLNHSYLKLHKVSLLSNGRSFLRPLPLKQTNKQTNKQTRPTAKENAFSTSLEIEEQIQKLYIVIERHLYGAQWESQSNNVLHHVVRSWPFSRCYFCNNV